MRRRFTVLPRRKTGDGSPDRNPERPGAVEPAGDGEDAVHVEEIDGIHLLRTFGGPSPDPMSVAELGYAMPSEAGSATIVVSLDSERAWPWLVGLLDSLRATGASEVRLVMSGAAADRQDRPAVARWIADEWDMRVIAPDGVALLVPGGSLFVPEHAERPQAVRDRNRGWWCFAPGEEPEPLGRQLPAPSWQAELERLAATAAGGTVVHRIPAGVLLRPEGAAPPLPGDLSFAVPVSTGRPVVIVGAPGDEGDVPAHGVLDVLAALPPSLRSAVRLAPGNPTDLLPTAQLAANKLGFEVEVLTGSPLMADDSPTGTAGHRVRAVLIGADGTPTWRPFVESVVCRPSGDGGSRAPRLLRWQPPVSGIGTAQAGVVRLPDGWQVAVTRAGLRICRANGARISLAGRPVDADAPAIELGTPGEPLDGPAMSALGRLLDGLGEDVRERAVLHVYGHCGGEQMRELSRVMASHGIRRLRTMPPPPSPSRVTPPPPSPSTRIPMAGDTPAPTAVPSGAAAAPAADPVAPPSPRRLAAPLLLSPDHHSEGADRKAFRALADPVWEQHSAAVSRALTQMPDPRPPERTDLVAVHLYLSSPDGPFSHRKLAEALRAGDPRVRPYAACLTSGLCHLPPYRGAVVRGGVPAASGGSSGKQFEPVPGRVLRTPEPVSALPADTAGPAATTRYAIWSFTGRRVNPLLSGTTEATPTAPDEIVFGPGTAFRVLDVREVGGSALVLLRELPPAAIRTAASAPPDGPEGQDRAVLARLTEALEQRVPAGSRGRAAHWPERCSGPVGWE